MISNLIKMTAKAFLILVLLATLIPMRSLAADPTDLGKITIEVTGENGTKLSGNWYLHQGINDKGMVLRNGSSGEVFNFSAGIYYLEVRNLKVYPYYKVFSANPQTLKVGGAIKFQVQYFKTEVQKANATSAPVPPTPVVPEVIPTPDPVVVNPVDDSTPDPVAPKKTPIKLTIVRPAVQDPAIAYDGPEEVGYRLATTGPNGLLGILLAFSLVSGLWIIKRKNA